jgi:DNA-binding NtrC family response regulator
MSEEPSILFFAKSSLTSNAFLSMLKKQGFLAHLVEQSTQLTSMLMQRTVSTVIVSMDDDEAESLSVIESITSQNPAIAILAITAAPETAHVSQALELGARDYFVQPIQDWMRFYHILRQSQHLWTQQLELMQFHTQMAELQEFRTHQALGEIKGRSEAIHHLLQEIQNIAPLDVPTLIIGESGVGKERVAKALHAESNREGRFVAVNCAAISPDLFEAELFGYKKGAFTGANTSREGLCKVANHGTLFLDEVGELPLPLQAKLLRLLEQKEYRPVGSDQSLNFAGRIVTATNVELEQAVQEGRFREDLYFRISVQELYVPPLRERLEDVQLLAYHFIEQFNQTCHREVHTIAPDALRMLESYDWHHNNVRELQREIQRALVRVTGGQTELLPEHLFWHRGKQRVPNNSEIHEIGPEWLDLPYATAKKQSHLEFLQRYLPHHLQRANGNKSQAAKNCGLQASNFSRLWREMTDGES